MAARKRHLGRVASVPLTALGSGAKVTDLFPLPLPIYLLVKLAILLVKYWYITAALLAFYFLHWSISLLILLCIPLALLTYVHLYNPHHTLRACLRAAVYLARTALRWRSACHHADLAQGGHTPALSGAPLALLVPWKAHYPPRIANENGTALEFTLNLASLGLTVSTLDQNKDYIAATLSARRTRVTRLTPGIGRIAIEWEANPRKSAVANPTSADKDSLHTTQLPRVQLDDDVLLELDTSLLVVGESGSGKSNLTWNILNGLNDYGIPYRLYVADPKKVELVDLVHSSSLVRYADNQQDITLMVDEFHQSMMDTFQQMAGKTRKITLNEENPLKILIFDELILCTKVIKNGQADTPLGEILSAGRAAGHIVIASSQLGQVDIIGRIRDLFPQRICLATKSSDLTNATLGPRAEERGARCSEITEKGVGYIYTDYHGTFQRFRPPYIPDGPDGIQRVAAGNHYEIPQPHTINFTDTIKEKISERRRRTCYTYRLYDQRGVLLYVGKAIKPTERIKQHSDKPFWNSIDHGKTVIRKYPTERAALEAETEAIHNEHPRYNIAQSTHPH